MMWGPTPPPPTTHAHMPTYLQPINFIQGDGVKPCMVWCMLLPNKLGQSCGLTDCANMLNVLLFTQILCWVSKATERPFQDELDDLLHQQQLRTTVDCQTFGLVAAQNAC